MPKFGSDVHIKSLKSEILINRGLLWCILAGIDVLNGSGKVAIAIQLLISFWCFIRAYFERDN